MINDSGVQVDKTHYFSRRYVHKDRWLNFWYQIKGVLDTQAASVMEVGVGNGLVRDTLRKMGITVRTLDIDPELAPDDIGSVVKLPYPDSSFDCVLCAEVLEHIPWEESQKAMREIRRVTRRWAVMTVPHAGYTFSLTFKFPPVKWKYFNFKIPHFWKTHEFNGQHYWETGKKGFSRARVKRAIGETGFKVRSMRINPDDPAHVFFICEKI